MPAKHCPDCDRLIPDCIDISGLSLRHQLALSIFVEKFMRGVRSRGDLIEDKDWTEDILEEEIDSAFYRIFELMRIRESK